jgi:hypothetical protein
MQAFATASAGFLLAVLWFDLMHDVLARGDGPTDEGLETIRRYYARVTRGAAPMNRLVMLAMIGLLATLVAELVGSSVPAWAGVASLVLAVPPIALAGASTVPTAVRLGQDEDPPGSDTGRARARLILRQHVFCFACIATVVAIQLGSLA